MEILEIRKVRGEKFGNFGIEFVRTDSHRSADRPCTSTQLKGHGLSTGGATIYIYIQMCLDIYINIYIRKCSAKLYSSDICMSRFV